MPINMLLTLLASLANSWPIVPISNDLQRKSSPSDVASTNAFMKVCHNAGTLIPIYTGDNNMSVIDENKKIHKDDQGCYT